MNFTHAEHRNSARAPLYTQTVSQSLACARALLLSGPRCPNYPMPLVFAFPVHVVPAQQEVGCARVSSRHNDMAAAQNQDIE